MTMKTNIIVSIHSNKQHTQTTELIKGSKVFSPGPEVAVGCGEEGCWEPGGAGSGSEVFSPTPGEVGAWGTSDLISMLFPETCPDPADEVAVELWGQGDLCSITSRIISAKKGPAQNEKIKAHHKIALMYELRGPVASMSVSCPSITHSAVFSLGSRIPGLTARS